MRVSSIIFCISHVKKLRFDLRQSHSRACALRLLILQLPWCQQHPSHVDGSLCTRPCARGSVCSRRAELWSVWSHWISGIQLCSAHSWHSINLCEMKESSHFIFTTTLEVCISSPILEVSKQTQRGYLTCSGSQSQ